MSPLRGFEPQAVSPIKVIPAGWRVSCAPLSTYLYSRNFAIYFTSWAEEEIWVDIREDSNLSLVNIAKKCSYS